MSGCLHIAAPLCLLALPQADLSGKTACVCPELLLSSQILSLQVGQFPSFPAQLFRHRAAVGSDDDDDDDAQGCSKGRIGLRSLQRAGTVLGMEGQSGVLSVCQSAAARKEQGLGRVDEQQQRNWEYPLMGTGKLKVEVS